MLAVAAMAADAPYEVWAKKRDVLSDVEVRFGGGAFVLDDRGRAHASLRVSPGLWFERTRVMWNVAVSYELSSVSSATVGVHVGLTGTRMPRLAFFEVGGLYDRQGRPGVSLVGGWGAIGLEAQVRDPSGPDPLFVAQLTLRIGLRRMGREFGNPSRI